MELRKVVFKMGAKKDKSAGKESPLERCDIRVWSGKCAHRDKKSGEIVYSCDICETIGNLDHEVHHCAFPYVSGDTEKIS